MEDNKHERKGKWHKAKRASRKDKRTARQDPITDAFENLCIEDTHVTVPSPAPSPCPTAHPSLPTLFSTQGYRGYLDYVNAEYCTSCPSCQKQKQKNYTWMETNAGLIDEEEGKFVAHEPAPNMEALYTAHGYEAIADHHPSLYCTDCPSCKLQHEANTVWLTVTKAQLSKEQDAYNEAKEREQERREWFDWEYRNKHY